MWSDYIQQDALLYPYKNVKQMQASPTSDQELLLRGRTLPRTIASIAKYGRLVVIDQEVDMEQDKVDPTSLPFVRRLCDEELEAKDVDYLIKYSVVDEATVAIFNLSKMKSSTSSKKLKQKVQDLSKYTEVILYNMTKTRNKSVIFRATIHQERKQSHVDINVDGYFLGNISLDEVEPEREKLQRLMLMYFPEDTSFQYKQRLHVPVEFCSDVSYLTYLFVYHLKEHGNYLQISKDSMLRMKLDLPETMDVLELHDSFLGQLNLDEINDMSYPFITTEYRGKDNLEILEEMGWVVVDVEGDGNCGFYVVFLGLENNGIKKYFVDTRRQRERPKTITESQAWIRQLARLRQDMRKHSEHMLTVIYPKDERNYEEQIWWGADVFEDKHVEGYMDEENKTYERGLSECLAPAEIKDPRKYVEDSFRTDMIQCHMNVYWGPHVLASMYKMRVIVIFRTSLGPEDEEAEDGDKESMNHDEDNQESKKEKYIWSTITFEYKNGTHSADAPHVELVWNTGLKTRQQLEDARVSDVEFKRVPTIEMLYVHKDEGGHFQFLRRVTCSGIGEVPNHDNKTIGETIQETRVREGSTSVPVVQGGTDNSVSRVHNDEVRETNEDETSKDKETSIPGSGDILVVTNNDEAPSSNVDESTMDVIDNEGEVPGIENPDNEDRTMQRTNNDEAPSNNENEVTMDVEHNDEAPGVEDPGNKDKIMEVADNNNTVVAGNNVNDATINDTNNDEVNENSEEEETMDVVNDHAVPVVDEGASVREDLGEALNDIENREDVRRSKKTQKMTRTKRVHETITRPTKSTPRKNSRAKKRRTHELAQQTKTFNKMCNKGEIPATRMMYDSKTNSYYTFNVVARTPETKHVPIKRTEVDPATLDEYNEKLVTWATQNPDKWVGPTVEDANVSTGDAPLELCTKVPCLYQQHNNPYCITYSFASALWYCGLRAGAKWMHDAAPQFAEMNDFDEQIEHLLSLTKNVVPWIGQPTIFGKKTKTHARNLRRLDWKDLFEERTRFPTIVLPILPDGKCTHAFCVVDDLIFDSTNPCALKLCMDSVRWLFRERETTIHQAFRFNQKWSPKNHKVKGRYRRKMKKNW